MSNPEPSRRLESVDLVRGIVMIIMVLDHVRDFFGDLRLSATNLDTTTPALFLTRWISHYCAPTFVFLAGTGAFLAGERGKSKKELSLFLATRGLWLMVLELTAVKLGLTFSLDFHFAFVQVIWVIGFSMVVLSLLIHLPIPWIAAFGIILIVGHNLFDDVSSAKLGAWGPLWNFLHEPGRISPAPGYRWFVAYPLIPWIGVMAAGYAFGAIYRLREEVRRPCLLALGLGLTLAFVALRASNLYGDPKIWTPQKTPLFTFFSFVNCQKYPPSLLYLLMTLGPAIFLLGILDRGLGWVGRPLLTFGRVPLFFYLLQWPVAHGLAILVAALQGQPYDWLLHSGPFGSPDGYGNSLPFVYLMWLVTLLILYPLCAWFADLKRRRRDAWLSYF